ncbi:YdcH family protein [Novosphingobium album (ex Liu et al. 2023)]|uniref:DUF465 domain-containing protein n=1 Tax=Novosphingobium album (ex Liu et al. 2023) TaxID=3031130 RepID=A0ABT5WTN3_9SPHN|nr:DUF465 domain-containing protein [Novosphingobium album (ex Liu et al. 2023)]MDE8653251.1 DUF465 domain-containing protein [Novosphingobium album (ex Liu et al. 2023)]
MSHTPHQLVDEFPEDGELLRHLKASNAHFATLVERYNEVNEGIYRIEAELEPASDDYAEELKRQRLALLDEIGSIITQERSKVA